MNEPSDVTAVGNENDVPAEVVDAASMADLAKVAGEVLVRVEDNTRRIAENAERIANAIESYCRLHGAKL